LIQPDDEVPSDEVAEELERIATLPADALLEDIAFACGDSPAPPWDMVARRPRRWLVLYARALGRIWKGINEPWAAARGLVEREIERVETAAARQALPELSANFHHRAEVRDGHWCMAHDETLELRLPEHGLVITPLLSGPGSARANVHDDGTLSAIHYPLPGAMRIASGDVLPPAAGLNALLGTQRAMILRLLDRPRMAGAIAEAMVATPAAASHHLRALEAAGLVIRERDGRRVIVHRSSRGSALLGLYDL
jgi:DNA-binding transcriptional ArsR family regulator